ncbi:type II secretion system protein [Nocardioides zeae]|uniref:Type II secretion system protein n=1 Tax=Nocardioides imazamoxiresistens TaxID=3231893 RepID=A0ABU3Q046_9ACTN|nr:type II secretion system protein [Nocardioides zeae]MDT9594881.1 type II secretion system protein [Nocardioides zeae]
MSSTPLLVVAPALGVVVGLLVGAAIAMLIAAVAGWHPRRTTPRQRSRTGELLLGSTARRRLELAGAVGVGVLVLTGWPVAAVAGGVALWLWPTMFGGAREGAAQVERLEAIAVWVESVRDTIAGAVGLEQALDHSVDVAPAVLVPSLRRLQGQLRARVPLALALDDFAAELDDRSADMVVAALKLSAQLRAEGLAPALSALAQSTRQELEMRRRIEEGRKKIRRTARHMMVIAGVLAGAMTIGARQYVEPYRSLTGQVVLGVVLCLIAVGLVWLRSAAILRQPERFLASHHEGAA